MSATLRIDRHEVHNGDGWMLGLRRTVDPRAPGTGRNPLLIVPGYGMNSFIFGFHPTGPSMEAALAARGFEVWSVDLRNQGTARAVGGTTRYTMEDLVLRDLAAAVRGVLERSDTGAEQVDLVGCSLGASLMFAYAVCAPDARAHRLVSMGGPVRWVKMHPLLKVLFRSPRLAGAIPVRGARRLAGAALPLLERVPWALSVYLHPEIVDMSRAQELIQTVEDPAPRMNRDIAEWVGRRDMLIRGRNVSEGVTSLRNPLLTVVANADGIVPRETALWPHQNIASPRREVLEVGTAEVPIAHADMFVSRHAPDWVFSRLADWLERDGDA